MLSSDDGCQALLAASQQHPMLPESSGKESTRLAAAASHIAAYGWGEKLTFWSMVA